MAASKLPTRPHLQSVGILPAAPGGLNRILTLLRSGTGHDFSQYKKMAIGRCIEWRMAQHEIEDTEVYARYLEEHPAEGHMLLKELLINVTGFFRDPEAFETLKKDVLPQLFAATSKESVFRVWVAGCATGEESYSLAMLLREYMDETRQELQVQIYSTDLDEDAIAVARAGTYPHYIVQDVESERLHRFFVKVEAGYQLNQEIREMVAFANQNVVKDVPLTGLDLISCRNLMIYLEPELQSRLITTFQFALRPGGALLLSPSESIDSHSDLFAPLSREWRIYRVMSAGSAMVGDGPASIIEIQSPGEKDSP